jgi:tetratricopeptide (TPR) repeat protein
MITITNSFGVNLMTVEGDNGFNINMDTIKSILLSIFENKSFTNVDNIEEPNQIIDSIIGDSFIKIITKITIIQKLKTIKYPIEDKNALLTEAKELNAFGIPLDTIADKLDYPIEKSEQILNRIKMLDSELLEVNDSLINGIGSTEVAKDTSETKSDGELDEDTVKEQITRIIEMGKNAYREGEYTRSIEIYDEGLEIDPDNTELRFLKRAVQAKIADMTMSKSVSDIDGDRKPEEPAMEPAPPATDSPEPPEPPSPGEPQEPKETEPPESQSSVEPTTEPSTSEPAATETTEGPETTQEPESSAESTQEPTAPSEPSAPSAPTEPSDVPSDMNKTFSDELDGSGSKIELLEKKLQEKVQALRDLAKPIKDLPTDACKSCEGLGKCYWCKGANKCTECSGSGKTDAGEDCAECKGSGECQHCKGTGSCHWCDGTGKKAS